ncbi:MAG: PEP-CTERM sorting domain-containing protein [Akkermansiaceae bacterium]
MKKTITILGTCLLMAGASQAVVLDLPAAGSYTTSSSTIVSTSQSYNGATFDIVYTLGAIINDTIDPITSLPTSVDAFVNSNGTQLGVGAVGNFVNRNATVDGDTGEGLSFTNLSIANFQANGSGVLESDITDLSFTAFTVNNAGNQQDGVNISFGTDTTAGDFNVDFSNFNLRTALTAEQTIDATILATYPTDLVTELFVITDNANAANRFGLIGLEVTYFVPEPSSSALLGMGFAGLFLRRRRS